MAPGILPSLKEENSGDLALEAHQHNEATPRAGTPEPLAEESPKYAISGPKNPESMENRLRPATDIINRIIWDSTYNSQDYTLIFDDRFEGRMEICLANWKRDPTDEEFVPQHRIHMIKRESDGEIVWDRRRRIDKVFFSGNSAFDFLAFLE